MSVQQPGGGGSTVSITGSLPAGANNIGSVDQHGAPWSFSQSGAIPAGTNVIGHVIVDTLPALAAGAATIGNVGLVAGSAVIGHVIVDTLPATPAGSNVIGHVIVDSLPSNLTAPSQKLANVAASQTDSALVTGVAAKVIYVVGLIVVCGATATTLVFNTKPAGAGTAISATFALAANGGFVWPCSGAGSAIFSTASGDGLTCTTGAGSTVGIQVLYSQV